MEILLKAGEIIIIVLGLSGIGFLIGLGIGMGLRVTREPHFDVEIINNHKHCYHNFSPHNLAIKTEEIKENGELEEVEG